MNQLPGVIARTALIVLTCFWPFSYTNAQTTQTQTIGTNLRSFNVPFEIDNEHGHYIEVQLFVSDDRGKTWKYHSSQDVDKNGFPFTCDKNGEYWFAIKSLDRNRRLVPAGNVTKAELVVIIDSQKPIVEFTLEADAAGRIISHWDIRDQYLNQGNLLLKHRGLPANGPPEDWIPVQFTPSNDKSNNQRVYDRIAWWPKTSSSRIEVQLVVGDLAGNVESVSRTVTRRTSSRRSDFSSTTEAPNPASNQKPSSADMAKSAEIANKQDLNKWICKDGVCQIAQNPISNSAKQINNKPPVQLVGSAVEFIAPPAPANSNSLAKGLVKVRSQQKSKISDQNKNVDLPPSSIEWESSNSRWTGQTRQSQASTVDQNQFPKTPQKKPALGINKRFADVPVVKQGPTQQTSGWQQNSNFSRGNLLISESSTAKRGNLRPDAMTTPAPNSNPNRNSIPTNFANGPTRATAFPQATNELQSNTSDVPVMNINTRRFNLNYGIKAINTSGVAKVILWATEDGGNSWKSWSTDSDNASPVPVEVDGEGVYGFKIVIHSKDGLVGKAPVSGESPDVVVHIDLSTPRVSLTSVPYGSGRDVGKLVMNWQATDPNLTERPIELFYSPNVDGPWTTVAKRLRNSGSYAWKVPKHVPENIFLRIDARDSAGNVGVYRLTSPLDISGLVPRGKIFGVEPIK